MENTNIFIFFLSPSMEQYVYIFYVFSSSNRRNERTNKKNGRHASVSFVFFLSSSHLRSSSGSIERLLMPRCCARTHRPSPSSFVFRRLLFVSSIVRFLQPRLSWSSSWVVVHRPQHKDGEGRGSSSFFLLLLPRCSAPPPRVTRGGGRGYWKGEGVLLLPSRVPTQPPPSATHSWDDDD